MVRGTGLMTVDDTLKPWLKPWLAGIHVGIDEVTTR